MIEKQYIRQLNEALENTTEAKVKNLVAELKKDPRIISLYKTERPYGYKLTISFDDMVVKSKDIQDDIMQEIKKANLEGKCKFVLKGALGITYDGEYEKVIEEAAKIILKNGWSPIDYPRMYELDTYHKIHLYLDPVHTGKNAGKMHLSVGYGHELAQTDAFDVSQTEQKIKEVIQKSLDQAYKNIKRTSIFNPEKEANFIFTIAENPQYKDLVSDELLERTKKQMNLN